MSTRRERAEKRRGWVEAANRRNGLVKRCSNCGEAGPHFVPPSLGDPGFYICTNKTPEIGSTETVDNPNDVRKD